jgi:FkbM family methyltransferase
MTLGPPAHPALLKEFNRWWQQNQSRSLACIWRRRSVWRAQVLQRLGRHIEVCVPLFFGGRMRVVTGETVSTSLVAFGYAEVAITSLMLHLLSEGSTVVDIGTHFGYEALLGSHLVGSSGRVIAFEPNPNAFAIASSNLAHLRHVTLHEMAVADRVGMARLQNRDITQGALNRLTEADDDNDNETIGVQVTTLDAALGGRDRPIDFLKCDVEGSELAVLKGAHEILTKDAPLMVLEADMPLADGQPSARAHELVAYLQGYGYQALSFDFNENLRVGPFGSFPTYHANVAFVP